MQHTKLNSRVWIKVRIMQTNYRMNTLLPFITLNPRLAYDIDKIFSVNISPLHPAKSLSLV